MVENVIKFLEEFFGSGMWLLSALVEVRNFGFTNVDFLHFFTWSTLFLFLDVAVVKWIISQKVGSDMLIEWLNPILEWLGIGLIPFLILILIVVCCLKGQCYVRFSL